MEYIDFASKISFYEFLHEEFKPPHFKTEDYKKEIELLMPSITIEGLAKKLEEAPKIFDIFEELLQLDHFTDPQYIHFCFDVNLLNNSEESLILKYLANRVFKFENGKPNVNFSKIYAKVSKDYSGLDRQRIFYAKRTIVRYVGKVGDRTRANKRKILYDHICNSIETRLRIATYLIENLNALDLLSVLDVGLFLKQKRHPVDPKGLRGRFGTVRISKILAEGGFADITGQVDEKTLSCESPISTSKEFAFVREKYLGGINKRKTRKPKKFDFILLHRGIPRTLIETNFFSTSGGGTKIGINEEEYTNLHEDIGKFNQSHGCKLSFMWITDGNYWLTTNGESRYNNLSENYFQGDFELLNYNLLRELLPKIKDSIK